MVRPNNLAVCTDYLYTIRPMSPVDKLIEAFGGIRAAQRALDEKHASVLQSWQKSGRIPHYREPQVRQAAEKAGVRLSAKLLAELFPAREAA